MSGPIGPIGPCRHGVDDDICAECTRENMMHALRMARLGMLAVAMSTILMMGLIGVLIWLIFRSS